MAGTFQARVQSYLGSNYTETANLSDNLTAGAKYITDLLPEDKIDEYAVNLSDGGSGVTVTGHRVIRAHKGGYRASRIDPGLKTQATASGALSTVAIVSGGSGYSLNDVLTLSQGTAGTCTVTTVNAGVVTAVEITTAGSAFTQGVKTTTVTPAGGTNCTLFVIPSSTSIYEPSTIDPIYYLENGKGYVLPGGGTIVGMAYPTIQYGDTSISNFPTSLEHGVILYAVIQGCISQINAGKDALNALSYATITPPSVPIALTLSSVAPTAPLDSSYSYTDATLGTYTATTVGSLGTVPTYTKPTTTFSITAANTYVATNQDLERAKSEIDNQNTLLNQYNLDIQNEQNEFNKDLEIYKSTFQTAIRQSELDQERLIITANKTTDLSIQNKAQTLNAAISLYKDKLQKFVSQIDLYQASVNSEIQLYAQNLGRLQGQLQLYSSQVQDAQIKYNSDQQKYTGQINHYNSILQGVKKEFEDFLKGRL